MIGDNFRMVMNLYITSDEAEVTYVISSPPMPRDTDIGPTIDELYQRQMDTMLKNMNCHFGVEDFRAMTFKETEAYCWGTHPHNPELHDENPDFRH